MDDRTDYQTFRNVYDLTPSELRWVSSEFLERETPKELDGDDPCRDDPESWFELGMYLLDHK